MKSPSCAWCQASASRSAGGVASVESCIASSAASSLPCSSSAYAAARTRRASVADSSSSGTLRTPVVFAELEMTVADDAVVPIVARTPIAGPLRHAESPRESGVGTDRRRRASAGRRTRAARPARPSAGHARPPARGRRCRNTGLTQERVGQRDGGAGVEGIAHQLCALARNRLLEPVARPRRRAAASADEADRPKRTGLLPVRSDDQHDEAATMTSATPLDQNLLRIAVYCSKPGNGCAT